MDEQSKVKLDNKKLNINTYVKDIGQVSLGFGQWQNRLQIKQSYNPRGGKWTSMQVGIDHDSFAIIYGQIKAYCEEIRAAKEPTDLPKEKIIIDTHYINKEKKEAVKTGSIIVGRDERGIFIVVRSTNDKHADFPIVTHYLLPDSRLTKVFVGKDVTLTSLKLSAYTADKLIENINAAVTDLLFNPVPVAPPQGGGYGGGNKSSGGGNGAGQVHSEVDEW